MHTMTNVILTEPRKVAKKKPRQGHSVDQASTEGTPIFGRIELQAPPEWIAELDRMAEAMGASRSAYIRMACNLKMVADRRSLGMDNKQPSE